MKAWKRFRLGDSFDLHKWTTRDFHADSRQPQKDDEREDRSKLTFIECYLKLVESISFNSFKYNAGDATAYLRCEVLVGLEDQNGALDTDFDGAVDAVTNAAFAAKISENLTC